MYGMYAFTKENTKMGLRKSHIIPHFYVVGAMRSSGVIGSGKSHIVEWSAGTRSGAGTSYQGGHKADD